MSDVMFRFTPEGEVSSDEPSLVEPLAHVLGQVLRLDHVPRRLPLVGHCPVGGQWCVFSREADEPEIRGVVLSDRAYAEIAYDPFMAGAAHLGGDTLLAAVRIGPAEPPDARRPAASIPEPLRVAYGCFLAGAPELRRGPYVSVLPTGLAPELTPLTCLESRLQNDQADSEGAAPGIDSGPSIHESEPRDDSAWLAVDLQRGGDTVAPPPSPAASAPPRPAASNDLEHRLAALERSLGRTRRMLGGGLVLVLIAGIAGGFALSARLQHLESDTVQTATLARGLGIEAGGAAKPDAIEAHLHDLATVAVQSGAWQAGLRRRGVEPARFLDQLVDLGQAHDKLLGLASKAAPLGALAGDAGPLTELATRSADLVGLATQKDALGDLAAKHDSLVPLAAQQQPLSALADQAKPLTTLAPKASALAKLAGLEGDLSTLARERSALTSLARRATPLRTLADDGAGLMVFWERYHEPLASLAERQASLEALVKRQRTLERLVESAPPLFSLAESDPLLRLVQRPDDLRALVDDLGDVLALADHRSELLRSPPPPRPRPSAGASRSSG